MVEDAAMSCKIENVKCLKSAIKTMLDEFINHVTKYFIDSFE